MKVSILYQLTKFGSNWTFNFLNDAIFTFSAYLSTWPQMIFDLGTWPLTAWTYECSHNIPINQVLFKSDFQLFKWGHSLIFSLSYNLNSDDLWPWYMTFDLINKWGFPCCIYDPTLVENHQSMWKIEPNVNPFSQQTTLTTTDYSGQSDPYVSIGRQHKNEHFFMLNISCTCWEAPWFSW